MHGSNRQIPIIIETFRDYYRYGYSISVHCLPCNKWVHLDLRSLIENGKGGQTLATAEFKCSACGRPGDVLVQTNDKMTRGEAPPPLPV